MTRCSSVKSATIAIAMWSLAAGSVANAAPATVNSVSPLVALSVYGTDQSRAALGTANGAAIATAAVAQGQPGYAEGDGGFDAAPLIFGLIGLAWAGWVIANLVDDDEGDILLPISPD